MAKPHDLRSFLERVRNERRTDLVEIEREVDPRYETTAILTKLEEKQRSPILFFRRVKGSRFPLVTNVSGSLGRLALALDCPMKDVSERYGVDLFMVDYHALAARPVDDVREMLRVPGKSSGALEHGSPGAFDREGMSELQRRIADERRGVTE